MTRQPLIPEEQFFLPSGIHLGSATCTPALREASGVIRSYHANVRSLGLLGNGKADVVARETRGAIGELLWAPDTVFFTDSCTDALALVADRLQLGTDDVVITAQTPYTGPWMAAPNVKLVKWRNAAGYLEAILAVPRPAGRVIMVVEAVDYVHGTRLDVPAIYAALKEQFGDQGILVVDAAQWGGVIKATRYADVICFPGNKWAMADSGIGFTWVRPALLPSLVSEQHRGLDEQGMLDSLEGRNKAKRTQPLWTLHQSIGRLLSVGGMPAMDHHIATLVDLATRGLLAGGAPVISPAKPEAQSWNVSLQLPGVDTFADAKLWCKNVYEQDGILLSTGGGHPRVRFTPFLFTTEDDVNEAVERLLRRIAV